MDLLPVHHYLWKIPKRGAMHVSGRIYASERLLEDLRDDPALTQVAVGGVIKEAGVSRRVTRLEPFPVVKG